MADVVDISIVGGTIVDGTGAPGRPGTVVIEGERLRLIPAGAEPPNAARTIDATGRVVAPGFIDLHSHGGLVILDDPRHEPKVRQGITTEVVGVDGIGFAPFPRREDLDAMIEMDAGLDGDPADRPRLGLGGEPPWPLRRQDEPQRRHADRQFSAPDRGTRLGRRAGRRPRTRPDAGAPPRRAAGGRGRPQLRARLPARQLCHDRGARCPDRGGGRGTAASITPTSGTRSATATSTRSARRSRSGGEPVRRPTSRTSTTARRIPGGYEALLGLVDDARAEGLDVTYDSYPYEWASTRLLIQLPGWIQAGGPGPLKQRLAERTARDRLREELAARGAAYTSPAGWADVRLGAFQQPAEPALGSRARSRT